MGGENPREMIVKPRDSLIRRLLTALADATPAFTPRPIDTAGGRVKRLLTALADATPAFRSRHGGPDEYIRRPDETSIADTSSVSAPEPQQDTPAADIERKLSVMIIVDHDRRDWIARVLTEKGMGVSTVAAGGAVIVRLAASTRPDIVLIALSLNRVVEVIGGLVKTLPETRILALFEPDDEQVVMDAISAGASGAMPLGSSAAELVTAIREAVNVDFVITPQLAELILAEHWPHAEITATGPSRPRLNANQVEVLRLVARGLTTKQVAERMLLSQRTVKNYLQSIIQTLRRYTDNALVRHAIESEQDAREDGR